ncbi:arachidonate 12-lipoxygenase, 12S-type isoform X1 [Scophthalmus maximus]|uniref:Arachidonate 12-lipoxygenase n=2 Tax=Scophthalmus maximus TaxID=52904 RepID=A0A8D3A8R4_SCOMX|nr:arachidonate 12-lipoxygenase, 12S-type isoform X1 [Scophthalmus maximus]
MASSPNKKMEVYTVTVATGESEYSGTNNYIFVTLVGEKGESERTLLDNPGMDFCRGAVDEYKVTSPRPLGSLLLVRLEKQRYWVEDNWFCRYVTVEPPGGDKVVFPCYRWLTGDIKVDLRAGTAKTQRDDALAQLLAHRRTELQDRQKIYRWVTWAPGIPRCIDAKTEADLPQDARFENEKRSDFEHSLHYALLELSLKKFAILFGKSWSDLDDFKRIFWKLKSPIAEYCMEHWKEDWFFGYQCLNGSNPRMIQRCKKLPENFPVTSDMVQSSMAPGTNLDQELKEGTVFLLDYAILDGVPTNTIKGKPQYIAAPLCLLYQHPDDGLMPIAIQLGQTPGLDTPIFLPKDPPLAWLLAKIWVRHAEFQVFQVLSHLLRTHLVVEVFCVATLRQLPAVHPIYKLLAPHLRYTLEINTRGRSQLISADGIFKRVVSTGGEGLLILAQREYKVLTYRSLQPYNDFADRGVSRLPNYFYREHSLMLWEAIHSFVSGMVSLYYQSDHDVQGDVELQAWIREIAQEGLAELPSFGLPSKVSTREELSTLLAVVVFTSTVQHAATNNGQFDWCAWVPNTPCTMRQPPPTDKNAATMEMVMASLPDVSQSCLQMAITWHLGRAQPDAIPLGHYTEEHFTEAPAVALINGFRAELEKIEAHILSQNERLELQYLFLLPSRIENSITI